MIPTYLTLLEEFPLTSNGKIDKAALPAPQAQSQPVTERAAPATFTETVLVDLYAAVLSLEQVGATDSFFDIGGSSLQVMRLVDMISKELGIDVGVSTVFLNPAPRQLAASIEGIRSGTAQQAGSGPLIELSSGVGELPLFLIHAIGGTVFAYGQLASELAGTFRVYGLEAPGLSQAGATASSLAGLADDYTQRIRTAQPAGPYRLAGWSMGGVIAFEIARRLELAGAEVSLLVLLDAPFTPSGTDVPAQAQLAGQFLADATHSLGWDAADLPDPASSNADEQLAWLAGRLGSDDDDGADAGTAGSPTAGTDGADTADGTDDTDDTDRDVLAAQLRRRFDIFQAHARMLAGYQPAAPAVQAPTLIVSADDSPNAPCRADWPRVLGGPVATQRVQGDHYSLLRSPLVAEVGTSVLNWHDDSE
jgi:thioesterase domain-containing protein/acyl carrier protein